MTYLRIAISDSAANLRKSNAIVVDCVTKSGVVDRTVDTYQVGVATGISDWECALLEGLLQEGDTLEDREFKVYPLF